MYVIAKHCDADFCRLSSLPGSSVGRDVVEESSVFGAVIVIMNVDGDEFVVVDLQNPRKRKRNEAAWQKNRAKHGRILEKVSPIGYRTYSHFIF